MKQQNMNDDLLQQLKKDHRKGVRQLVTSYEKKLQKEQDKLDSFLSLQQFDQKFRQMPTDYLAGVDEAGRGPLAGPVVAAAVILPPSIQLIGINDSKQLSENSRQLFYEKIVAEAISYYVAIIDNETIDKLNIYEATKKAMMKALTELKVVPPIALIDAVPLHLEAIKTKSIVKGDEKSLSIAAASILAKVTRDQLMGKLDSQYPQFEFAKNKGYGTKGHLEALKIHGSTPYHRQSFSPVSQYEKMS